MTARKTKTRAQLLKQLETSQLEVRIAAVEKLKELVDTGNIDAVRLGIELAVTIDETS